MTKFIWVVAVKSTHAQTTVEHFEDFVCRFGAPGRIISDRGTSFTAHCFQAFSIKYGIKHTLNSSRHPQANGLIERLNRTLLSALKTSVVNANANHWDRNLKQIERDINATVSSATGKTPFEALYGYVPRFDEGGLRKLTTDNESYTLPSEVQETIRKQIIVEQTRYKRRYDKNRLTNVKYNIGDIVFMKQNPK